MVRLTSERRLYVAGRRIHHGRAGWWLVKLGVLLMLHDILDWPWPVRDRNP